LVSEHPSAKAHEACARPFHDGLESRGIASEDAGDCLVKILQHIAPIGFTLPDPTLERRIFLRSEEKSSAHPENRNVYQ
jgi:hypothetical protein